MARATMDAVAFSMEATWDHAARRSAHTGHVTTTHTGRDGRPLVTTTQAAYSLGVSPKQFRDWARRRALAPAGSRPNPARGQALALWDLADIADAVRRQAAKQPSCQGA